MAGMKSIDEALRPLEETMLHLDMLLKSYRDLAGDNDPPWLWLIGQLVTKLDEAVDGYTMAVHEHARPVLNDLARLTAK
jgi:hypothetical protein